MGGRFTWKTTGLPIPTTTWELVTLTSNKPLPAGKSEIRFELDYDGGGAGKGADLRLKLNGEVVVEGRMEKTIAASPSTKSDVGLDRGSAVTVRTIGPRRYSAYGGQIDKVTIQIIPKPPMLHSSDGQAD